jgi:hypothetical protein
MLFKIYERVERNKRALQFEIRNMYYPGGTSGPFFQIEKSIEVIDKKLAKKISNKPKRWPILCKSFNDNSYSRILARVKVFENRLKTSSDIFNTRLLEYFKTVESRYTKWYLEYDLEPPGNTSSTAIVRIAPIKYQKEHFEEVDRLWFQDGYTQTRALDEVCENYSFNRESFEKMYRRRHLDVKRKGGA